MKRGILQYVQIKPILAVVTLILKAVGKYHEGDLAARSGYLYVSVVYNLSICLSLYCLAMFWMCVNDDLKPFRPMPKFLCVKGILFFSFWQSIGISILVAAGVITKLGPYMDREKISLGLSDTLICLEMPVFAIAHLYAFSFTDFVDPDSSFVARMRIKYALKDSFGLKDVLEDSKATLRGEGMDYREFESSEGFMHQGVGRDRRIRAGLRYSQGGKRKYWLPQPIPETPRGPVQKGWNRALEAAGRVRDEDEVHAPLLQNQVHDIIHNAPDLEQPIESDPALLLDEEDNQEGYGLSFGELDDVDEELFSNSRGYLFGDYNYPVIDASSEYARKVMWDEEERILSDVRGAYFSPILGPRTDGGQARGYGATGNEHASSGKLKQVDVGTNPPVIDKANDRAPNLGTGEVRLSWTKAPQKKKSQNLIRNDSHPSSSSSSSSSPSAGSPGRGNKRSAPPTPQNQKRPILPPDAVDLIVEDDEAAEEITKERRTSDPAIRTLNTGGLRRVYRRGYVAKDVEGQDQGKGEVEVDNEPVGEVAQQVEGGVEVVAGGDGEERLLVAEDRDEMVVQAESPPAHARALLDSALKDEDNPWA